MEALTSLAMSLEALAAFIEMASVLKSQPFFFSSSQPALYSFLMIKQKKKSASCHWGQNGDPDFKWWHAEDRHSINISSLRFLPSFGCPSTYITHSDLVHFGEQNVWCIGHDVNGGLVFIPFLNVAPLQQEGEARDWTAGPVCGGAIRRKRLTTPLSKSLNLMLGNG